MYNIILSHIKNRKKFNILRKQYENKLTQDELIFIKSVLFKIKRCVINENVIVLGYIYWLYFFKIINIDDKIIDNEEREKIRFLEKSFRYENSWEFKKYLESIFEIEKDLLKLKLRIKSTILSFWDKYLYLIPNKKNYFKAIWYAIPFLTMKWSKILSIFQDTYFERLYEEQYIKTKKFYKKKINTIEFPWEHINMLVNDLSDLMYETNILWKTKIRRKSYFSLYNKLKRKKHQNIYDILWIMIVFKNLIELNKFIATFEKKFIYIEKKDYIKNPKKNWYKSIHYKFMTMYRNKDLWVELQLKTQYIEKQLEWVNIKSHYNYTMNEKKWDSKFIEVTAWYKILKEYIKK